MERIIFSGFLILCLFSLKAQEEMKAIPLFGQVDAKLTSFLKSPAMMSSYRLHYLHDLNKENGHKAYFGVHYNMLTSSESINEVASVNSNQEFVADHVSAGVVLGYMIPFGSQFNFSPDVSLSWANLIYAMPDELVYRQNYFQMEPFANVTVSLKRNKLFHFGLGAGFRLAAGLKTNGIKSTDVMGPTGQFFIRIGRN